MYWTQIKLLSGDLVCLNPTHILDIYPNAEGFAVVRMVGGFEHVTCIQASPALGCGACQTTGKLGANKHSKIDCPECAGKGQIEGRTSAIVLAHSITQQLGAELARQQRTSRIAGIS